MVQKFFIFILISSSDPNLLLAKKIGKTKNRKPMALCSLFTGVCLTWSNRFYVMRTLSELIGQPAKNSYMIRIMRQPTIFVACIYDQR